MSSVESNEPREAETITEFGPTLQELHQMERDLRHANAMAADQFHSGMPLTEQVMIESNMEANQAQADMIEDFLSSAHELFTESPSLS